jgi:DNA-directed RNA polymerase specialized sigma24 family protein
MINSRFETTSPIYDEYVFPAALTPAEKEIIDQLDAGQCLESAAEALNMPVTTAAWRLHKARRKTV